MTLCIVNYLGSKGSAVVKALPLTHQFGSGLNFWCSAICELSLLLVCFLAPLTFWLFTLLFLFPINQCFQIPLRSGYWRKNHYMCGCVTFITYFFCFKYKRPWLFSSKPLLFLFFISFIVFKYKSEWPIHLYHFFIQNPTFAAVSNH